MTAPRHLDVTLVSYPIKTVPLEHYFEYS